MGCAVEEEGCLCVLDFGVVWKTLLENGLSITAG